MPADTRRGGPLLGPPGFSRAAERESLDMSFPRLAGCRAGGSDGQCAGFSIQNMNGCEEGVGDSCRPTTAGRWRRGRPAAVGGAGGRAGCLPGAVPPGGASGMALPG